VPLTVTQVCDQARGVLDGLGRVCVIGEVSNFSGRTHWYFSIKDAKAVLGCVMWERTAQSAAVQPCNGMEVVVTGKLTYYAPSARTQLVVETIERRGMGSLQQRLEELCRVLRSEGYFDESRKRRLPAHPRRIAVITSKHGAALQDVLRTCAMRAPFVDILVVEVAVQGEAAAPDIVRAIRAVDRRADELGIDAMIVTRGGGSLEDLWAFNDRTVADAVFKSTTPVVAAIGHETDTTVIELVADRRASTPTQAAMLLLPDGAQLGEQVDHLTDRLSLLTRKCVRDASRTVIELQRRLVGAPKARLDRAARRLAELRTAFEQLRPATRQALARQRLASLRDRLNRAQAEQLARARQHADTLWRQLRVLGPEQVLARGYSLTFAADGALLRRAHDAQPGDQLLTKLAEGSVTVTVNHPIPEESASPPASP
jgi:exodeoxyribonuclease VII large subunit